MSDYLYDPSDPFYDPAADPEALAQADAYLNYILGGQSNILGGAAPSLYESPYQMLGGLVPQEVDMLAANKKAVDYLQDVMMMTADPLLAGYGGPGAFAPGTFEPIVTETEVDRPGYRYVSGLAAQNDGTFRSRLAQRLLEGESADRAIQEILTEINQYQPESEEYEQALITLGVPRFRDEGVSVADESAIWATARDLEERLVEDEQPGTFEAVIDPTTGQTVSAGGERFFVEGPGGTQILMQRTTEEAPQAEHFRELGLPLPTEEFTPEYILGEEPFAAQTAAFDANQAALANYLAAAQAERGYTAPQRAARPAPVPAAAAVPAAPPNYDVLSSGWPGTGTSISQAGIGNTATVAQPGGAPLAPSTDILDVIPGGAGMTAGSVQPAPGTPAAAISEVIALGDASDVNRWMTDVYPTLRPEDRAAVDAIIASQPGGDGGGGGGADLAFSAQTAGLAGVGAALRQLQGEQPEPPPRLDYGSDPATYEEYLAQLAASPYYDPTVSDRRAQAQRALLPPRPPDIPPNQGGLNLDLDFTPTGGLAGPPGRSAMEDAMLAALLGGQRGSPPGPVYDPTVSDRRAQAQRALIGPRPPDIPPNQGGFNLDLDFTPTGGLAGPPGRSAMQDAMVAALLGGGDRTGRQVRAPETQPSGYPPIEDLLAVLPGGTGEITPANYGGGPNPPGYPPVEEFLAALPGGTGEITPANYGGGPTPAGGMQIQQYLANATARPRRSGARTGEERTAEQRRAQARRNVPAEPEYNPLAGELPSRSRRTNQARRAWRDAYVNYIGERQRTGFEKGYAWGMAQDMQRRGVTPYIATVAARQQVPMAAGINTPGRIY